MAKGDEISSNTWREPEHMNTSILHLAQQQQSSDFRKCTVCKSITLLQLQLEHTVSIDKTFEPLWSYLLLGQSKEKRANQNVAWFICHEHFCYYAWCSCLLVFIQIRLYFPFHLETTSIKRPALLSTWTGICRRLTTFRTLLFGYYFRLALGNHHHV